MDILTLFLSKTGDDLINAIASESELKYASMAEKNGYEKLELLYGPLDDVINSLNKNEESP